MLYEAEGHELLTASAWNEQAAQACINEILDDAVDKFSARYLWPSHLLDSFSPDARWNLYIGAAGTIWALHHLSPKPDFLYWRRSLRALWKSRKRRLGQIAPSYQSRYFTLIHIHRDETRFAAASLTLMSGSLRCGGTAPQTRATPRCAALRCAGPGPRDLHLHIPRGRRPFPLSGRCCRTAHQ